MDPHAKICSSVLQMTDMQFLHVTRCISETPAAAASDSTDVIHLGRFLKSDVLQASAGDSNLKTHTKDTQQKLGSAFSE